GRIFTFPVNAEDVRSTKEAAPDIQIYQADITSPGWNIYWGFRDDPQNYFRDSRVRQAFAHAMDRDLYIDVMYNISRFESEGMPLDTRWNATIAPVQLEWWLDPQGSDFGPTAKYFQHDPEEARKLL